MSQVRLLRNATLVVTIEGFRFLVDPLLAEKDSYDPIVWTSNNIRNPTVELPVSHAEIREIISAMDGVIITHTHNDHWDEVARQLIPKDKLLIGQPADQAKFIEQGYTNVCIIDKEIKMGSLRIIRTGGHHGTGEIGAMMGAVSGFILQGETESIYIAGDTIWCSEVKEAISKYQPATIVLNAGAAQFDKGDPIIMNIDDVLEVCKHSKASNIICVHMEALNHCYLRREALMKAIGLANESGRCRVPADGEVINC